MYDSTGVRRPFCAFCGEKTGFSRHPVEVKTRIGARRRLVGCCARCGSEVSCFLPSENGPTVHSVRVGDTVLRELQRASALLGVSQRAIVENIVVEHLEGFVGEQLAELEAAGLITVAERRKRERGLQEPIEGWTPPEREDPEAEPGLLGFLKGLLS